MMKLASEEKELLESVESGEWRSVPDGADRAKKYQEYAKATFRKDERINIRISQRDLVKLQQKALEEGMPYQTLGGSVIRHQCRKQKALEEGMPYQTLITMILHKYVQGKLVDKVLV